MAIHLIIFLLKHLILTTFLPFETIIHDSITSLFAHSLTRLFPGPVFTKILSIFLRIILKSKKNSLLRIFLFLEKKPIHM